MTNRPRPALRSSVGTRRGGSAFGPRGGPLAARLRLARFGLAASAPAHRLRSLPAPARSQADEGLPIGRQREVEPVRGTASWKRTLARRLAMSRRRKYLCAFGKHPLTYGNNTWSGKRFKKTGEDHTEVDRRGLNSGRRTQTSDL